MKKQTLLISGAILLLTVGVFTACKKNSSEESKDPVAFYSKKFMTDETFVTFFKTMVTNSFKLNKLAGNDRANATQRTTMINISDTAAAYNYVSETVTAEVLMKAENPGFFELTPSQQTDVMNAVCNNLAVESYRQANATTPLVVFATETLDYLNQNGPMLRGQLAINITWGEFALCTAGALGAALAEYGGVLGQVWNLLSQGSQYLTWGGVFQIVGAVVRNAVPWYKVASVAIGYATCLWAAA
jgi:hypothetical protein